MGGLEAVYLRNGSGDNDAHCIGHVVSLQSLGDGLFQYLGLQPNHIWIIKLFLFLDFFLSHFLLTYLDLPDFIFLPVTRFLWQRGQAFTAMTPRKMTLPQLGQRQYLNIRARQVANRTTVRHMKATWT